MVCLGLDTEVGMWQMRKGWRGCSGWGISYTKAQRQETTQSFQVLRKSWVQQSAEEWGGGAWEEGSPQLLMKWETPDGFKDVYLQNRTIEKSLCIESVMLEWDTGLGKPAFLFKHTFLPSNFQQDLFILWESKQTFNHINRLHLPESTP